MSIEGEPTLPPADIRVYRRGGLWYWCLAEDYSSGPFADGDDFGPFSNLQSLTDSVTVELQIAADSDLQPTRKAALEIYKNMLEDQIEAGDSQDVIDKAQKELHKVLLLLESSNN